MAKNRVIGKDNDMPWGRLPADLKHFKETTQGHTVIMGRKTFDSIGKPLPNRRNIIITSKKEIAGCEVASSVEDAIALAQDEKEVFIIGGGSIYEQTLPVADRLYLTSIDMHTEGDTFFPSYSHLKLDEISHSFSQIDEKNPHSCTFVTYTIKEKRPIPSVLTTQESSKARSSLSHK